MAIDLKKTDVVIIGLGAVGGVAALPLTRSGLDVVGLGAVGGVAALPLARAGLEVIGLEAGSWLTPRDFAPTSCATISAAGRRRRRRRTAKSRPTGRTPPRPIRHGCRFIP